MVVAYPARGVKPWDLLLKAYIDSVIGVDRLDPAVEALITDVGSDTYAALIDFIAANVPAGPFYIPRDFDSYNSTPGADNGEAVRDAFAAAQDNGGGTVLIDERYFCSGLVVQWGGVGCWSLGGAKVEKVDTETDIGLFAYDETFRYRHGLWDNPADPPEEKNSQNDNPGALRDLVISGRNIAGGDDDPLFITSSVDPRISGINVTASAGDFVLIDGAQNGTIEQSNFGFYDGHDEGKVLNFSRIGRLGQGAAQIKVDKCYIGTGRLQLHSTSDPLNFWPHEILLTDTLFENRDPDAAGTAVQGDLIELHAGDFIFTRCTFTSSDPDNPPPNDTLILVDNTGLLSETFPTTFIPTQVTLVDCYFNAGEQTSSVVKVVANPGVDVGGTVRIGGVKTYVANKFDAIVDIDGGVSGVSIDGNVVKGSGVKWVSLTNGGSLASFQIVTPTSKKYEQPSVGTPNPVLEFAIEGQAKNYLQLELSTASGWKFRSLNGADSVTRGTFGTSPFDSGYGLNVTSRFYLSGGLCMTTTVNAPATANSTVSISARDNSSYAFNFNTSGKTIDSFTLTDPIAGGLFLLKIKASAATSGNSINWAGGTPITWLDGIGPQPIAGKTICSWIHYSQSGARYEEMFRSIDPSSIPSTTGLAPLASPAFTGNPTAPTPTAGDNDTSIATTAFVKAAIDAVIAAAPGALDTLNELATALGNDANFAATMTALLAAKAPLASPALTGAPTAPTASGGDNTTKIATTAFVVAALAAGGYATLASPVFTGNPQAPTPTAGDSDTSIATTAFVQGEIVGKAPLASPVFTGNPTAPTPSYGDNDTSVSTTAFVQSALNGRMIALAVAAAIPGGTPAGTIIVRY